MTVPHAAKPGFEAQSAGQTGPAKSTPPRAATRVAWFMLVPAYLFAGLMLFWQPKPGQADAWPAAMAYGVFMLRTFAFHLGLVLLMLVSWALLRKQHRLAVATLAPLLVALVPALADWLPPTPPPAQGPTFRLMHFNLLYLNRNQAAIAEEIGRADADVLLLHEFTPDSDRFLTPRLAQAYPHRTLHPQTDSFGWAVFSRFPLAEPPTDLAPPDVPNRRIIRLAVRWQDQLFALYAVHLNPPKSIHGLVTQGQGLNQLLSLIEAEPLPLIVCGDFNFTARHRMHRLLLERNLRDAHRLAGWGRQSTWPCVGPLRWAPGVRIDHLFLGQDWTCTTFATGASHGSDHKPIIADIGLAANSAPLPNRARKEAVAAESHP